MHQGQAELIVRNLAKGLEKPRRMGLGKHAGQWVVARLIVFPVTKKRANRDAENGGDSFKSAASDPVSSHLVFLNLLKRHADFLTECRLRHTLRQAISPHTLSDLSVYRFDALYH